MAEKGSKDGKPMGPLYSEGQGPGPKNLQGKVSGPKGLDVPPGVPGKG